MDCSAPGSLVLHCLPNTLEGRIQIPWNLGFTAFVTGLCYWYLERHTHTERDIHTEKDTQTYRETHTERHTH